jgi:hypothetical protein
MSKKSDAIQNAAEKLVAAQDAMREYDIAMKEAGAMAATFSQVHRAAQKIKKSR